MRLCVLLALAAAFQVQAQQKLSLREAVQLALQQNKSVSASQASVDAATSKVNQARAGMFPKLNYSESITRSNNPVFVFGSLLAQHRFAGSNFDIYALNRPGFLDNFQSAATVDQTLFDAGQTRNAVRASNLGREIAAQNDLTLRNQVIFGVVKSYWDVSLAEQALVAATQAAKSGEADLERAEQVRTAGMSTDADVLSIRVHLARIRGQQIRREADLATARAALNDALGLPIDANLELTTELKRLEAIGVSVEALETIAVSSHPEQRRANLATELASRQVELARSSYWPKIVARGVFEADRQQFVNRGGANWLGQISLTWNVFNGGADRARITEASSSLLRTQAERDRLSSSLRLEVRRAWNDLRAAAQQVDVAETSVLEAEESLRITKNRFGAGMSTVTDLLRTEAALLDARTLHAAALHDQRIAAALLDLASGKLSIDSPAINE
jgi:outer membrane protein TolC